ncbi:alkaline phosphatase D family protein [Sphingomonas panaciterrae]|uniref:alkaline phosphatase D family protein n=1 Tax=Sphingomonas panaciterrae TaxID=1462999 RepID=UPI002FF2DEDB
MSPIDRRRLLTGLIAAGGGIIAAPPSLAVALGEDKVRPRNLRENPVFLTTPFQLGVASGDPSADGFVLWTRLAPEPLAPGGGMPIVPVLVGWEVAADEGFRTIVAKGDAIAHPELGHAVHVEVAGLAPDRPYWYRFRCGSERSFTGRSRTFPLPGARTARARFAVAGCQHYEEGHYTAWRRIAETPLDFVFHYGDYIYEGRDNGDATRLLNGRAINPIRRHIGQEIYSLDDYRRRYALYKTDPDLQAAHAAAPWLVSFDDHEIDNNWAADIDQDGTPPEIFRLRRAAAMQAYYEHMPLRRRSLPLNGHMQMYRHARFGDLIDAHVLDTRQYRSDQVGGDRDGVPVPEVFAENRTMLGAEQEKWLFDGLVRSDARWNLIAQQVMLMAIGRREAPGTADLAYPMDVWSGYRAPRQRLLHHIRESKLTNVITISGDAHRHYAGDLIPDDSDNPVASEYLATSVTSGGDGTDAEDALARSIRFGNNHFLKAMSDRRGYLLCDVDRERWRGELKVLSSVTDRVGRLRNHAVFVTDHGKIGLQAA